MDLLDVLPRVMAFLSEHACDCDPAFNYTCPSTRRVLETAMTLVTLSRAVCEKLLSHYHDLVYFLFFPETAMVCFRTPVMRALVLRMPAKGKFRLHTEAFLEAAIEVQSPLLPEIVRDYCHITRELAPLPTSERLEILDKIKSDDLDLVTMRLSPWKVLRRLIRGLASPSRLGEDALLVQSLLALRPYLDDDEMILRALYREYEAGHFSELDYELGCFTKQRYQLTRSLVDKLELQPTINPIHFRAPGCLYALILWEFSESHPLEGIESVVHLVVEKVRVKPVPPHSGVAHIVDRLRQAYPELWWLD